MVYACMLCTHSHFHCPAPSNKCHFTVLVSLQEEVRVATLQEAHSNSRMRSRCRRRHRVLSCPQEALTAAPCRYLVFQHCSTSNYCWHHHSHHHCHHYWHHHGHHLMMTIALILVKSTVLLFIMSSKESCSSPSSQHLMNIQQPPYLRQSSQEDVLM